MWDPFQYARFSDERSRPFFDLFHQLPDVEPSLIIDLGCGSGELTRVFTKRWRNARVLGIDNAPTMLEVAQNYQMPGKLEFHSGDIAHYFTGEKANILFSNAALQWIPNHERLFPHLTNQVDDGGILAVQMPNNFSAPSHLHIRELCDSPAWKDKFSSLEPRAAAVLPLDRYVQMLMGLGFKVDAWETTYLHVLQGEDPVLEWVRGTALRPILHHLGTPDVLQKFLCDLGERLRQSYPPGPNGTLFPFNRIFIIAVKKA